MTKSKKKSVETDIKKYLGLRKNDKNETVKEKQKTNGKSKQKTNDKDDLISRRRERNRLQMRRLRASNKYRKEEYERNRKYRLQKRKSDDHILKMRESQKKYMRKMRSDENYRTFERHRDKMYRRRKRKDLDHLEQIRAKDREYKRRKRAKLKMMNTHSDIVKEESILDEVKIKIESPTRITRSRAKPVSPKPSKSSFREVDFELFVLQKRSKKVKPVLPKKSPSNSGFREVDFDLFVLKNMEFIKKPNEFSDEDEI